MKRYGLIGYPLGHSFSKKYFTEKFGKEGLEDHIYELFPLEDIGKLPALIKAHPDLCGLNVTIPYKQDVLRFLHETALPEELNACNCIKIDKGRLTGYNTDVIGFQKSFSPHLSPHHKKALVLGNGGATAAVIHVLKKLGLSYQIVSRKIHGLSTLTYEDLNQQVIEDHQVIINTTPVGTYPDVERCPSIPYQYVSNKHYLFDLIYNPPKTLFLKKGEERGAKIMNGYEMLIIQAEESWKIWNG